GSLLISCSLLSVPGTPAMPALRAAVARAFQPVRKGCGLIGINGGLPPVTTVQRMRAPPSRPDNAALAASLRELADLLTEQGADGFRVAAWRRGADIVERLDRPVAEILSTQGREGLIMLPGIGYGIAAALAELVTTGHWAQLDRLRGTGEP